MTTKPYRIEWRPMARQDLRGIVRYIGKDNPTRAVGFGREISGRTAPLARYPDIGRPGRLEGTRELIVHPNYIVFYRVLHETRTVQILRVKHAAQRWP